MRKESLTSTRKNDRRKVKGSRGKKRVSERVDNWQGISIVDQTGKFTALQDALLDPHTNHEGF